MFLFSSCFSTYLLILLRVVFIFFVITTHSTKILGGAENFVIFFLIKMKVYLRDVKKTPLEVDVEENATVIDVKRQIAEKFDISDLTKIRLIFKSKVLDNTVPVSSIGYTEENKIVYYIPAKKESKPATDSSSPSQSQPAAAAPVQPSVAQPAPQSPQPQATHSVPPRAPNSVPHPFASPAPQSPESSVPTGAPHITVSEENINHLMEMGYSREVASFALKITRNNLEHAGSLIGEGYDTLDKLQDLMLASQSQMDQSHVSGEQARAIYQQILGNPQLFQYAITHNGIVPMQDEYGTTLQVQINVNELLAMGAQMGLLQRTPDGKIAYVQNQPMSAEDQESYMALHGEFNKLTPEQQQTCTSLAREFNIDIATVLQYYSACEFNESNTRELLRNSI